MLSKSEDEVVTERLKNWGRAIADHPRRRTSPLYWLRIAAAVADGSREATNQYIDDIDWKDAEVVNKAWRTLPERPERYRKAKRILALWYAFPNAPRWMVRRELRIPDRHLQFFLDMGKEMIWAKLQNQDSAS